MKKGKKILSLIAAVFLGTGMGGAQPVQAAVDNAHVCAVDSNGWKGWPQAADIQSGTGILIDAETGTVLFSKGIDDQRYPASITKIMTVLVALENSTPDMTVTFTETGMADAYSGSSNILPQLGETFTMEQCVYMMMLKSANDVCTQVAETIGGSVQNYVNMMNEKAAELGCTNTHFNNANGLPDENHYTSAHDMALIAQEAFKNETFRKVVSTQSYTVPATNLSGAREYANHHKLLLDGSSWHYDGCLGGKTGYTDSSLSTLVTYAQRNGLTLISVVMYGLGDDVVCKDTTQLLDYGFSNFSKNAEGRLVTSDGKILYENQALTEMEYEQATATPTPSPALTSTPEEDTEDEEKTHSGGADTPAEALEDGGHEISKNAGIAIAVLSVLIVVGLIMIIVLSAKSRKKSRRRRKKEEYHEER